jgi:hypothetical protein
MLSALEATRRPLAGHCTALRDLTSLQLVTFCHTRPYVRDRMPTQSEFENWFTYHPPIGDQQARYVALRDKAKEFAELFVASSRPCADQTAALRKLREVVMAMNLTIACNEAP